MSAKYDETKSAEENLARAVFALAEAVDDGLGSVAHRIEELSDTFNHHAGAGFSVTVEQKPPSDSEAE